MQQKIRARLSLGAPLVACGLLVSGCMSSPTYGTGKTANAQLTEDLTNIVSMKPKTNPVGEYKPRPELVKPASLTELPPPQDNVTTASNVDWPESPEQKRARLRAIATENQDDASFEPMIVNDIDVGKTASASSKPWTPTYGRDKIDDQTMPQSNLESRQARDEINKKLAENKQGSSTTRKYLSEPPLAYRQPAETAPVGDVGEDEAKKARRIKKQATKSGGWKDLVPWL